jgi:hypothetical protein
MITALVTINVLVVLALLWMAVDRVTRWPAPNPRPFACATCRVDYTDARALAWHLRGQHPDTYDHAIGGAS